MITTRRTFMAAGIPALTLLGHSRVPAPIQAPAPDPVLSLIENQTHGIHDALLEGDSSPALVARFEQVLRIQAVHVRQYYDGPLQQKLGGRIEAAGGREAFAAQVLAQSSICCSALEAEVRKRYPRYRRPNVAAPPLAPLQAALEDVERNGLSARFDVRADALRKVSARPQARVVQARYARGQSWYDTFCGWWDTSNQIDDALLQAFCAWAILFEIGPFGEIVCAVWAVQNSAEDLMYMLIC